MSALLLTLSACRGLQSFDTPIPRDVPWDTVEPTADDLARFDDARGYLESVGGLSLLVIEGEHILYEAYFNGHSAETPWPLWSGTKTFSCAIAAQGIDQGLFSLDTLAATELTEWADDPLRSRIELQHLLHFTSGLEDDWWTFSRDGWAERPRVDDKYAAAIAQPAIHEPGEVYEYASVHLTAWGAYLERRLGESPLAYLEREVLDPIGFRTAGWNHDPDGNPALAFGAWTTTTEWARFGVLLRDDGLWQGQRVLPEGTRERCATGSTPNPAYGLAVWLNREVPPGLDLSDLAAVEPDGPIFWADGPTDMLIAAGAQGQRLYVLPSQDRVVVYQCDRCKDLVDAEVLERLLGD